MNLLRHLEVLKESLRLDRAERGKPGTVDPGDVAFLPAALEILETPPSPVGRAVLWVLIAFVGLAIGWSCLGKIDVVSAASGKVAPYGHIKVIQAADEGVIRAIHVRDGQAVVAGQPLVELDPTVSKAEVEQARQAFLSASIDVARARALTNYAQGKGGVFVSPAGADPVTVADQRALVAAKIREHDTAAAELRQEVAQHEGDYHMVSSEHDKLQQQLPLAQGQLDAISALEAKGFWPKMKVDETKERVVGIRQDLAIRQAEMAKNQAAAAGAREQLAKLDSQFAREALDALTEAEASRVLREQELKKAQDKASLTVLAAPETGVVAQMQVHTLGGVVKPADTLMIIVPRDGALVVEAQVLNRDVGFVHPGQKAEVKLEAFPFTRYGVVQGEVEQVSRDAVEDKKEGLVFPAIVRIPQPWLMVGGRKAMLAPGLAATAEIKTGHRRIIEYLLSPLSRRMQEAGRER